MSKVLETIAEMIEHLGQLAEAAVGKGKKSPEQRAWRKATRKFGEAIKKSRGENGCWSLFE